MDERYMAKAIQLAQRAAAKGEVPVGCVIVQDGRIIARAGNEVETQFDATRHAEMIAIRKAARRLKNWRLAGCTVYVTKEPCPMCAAALALARVHRVVFGLADPFMGACGSKYELLSDGALRAKVLVTRGVLEAECRNIFKDFFRRLR